MRSPAVFILFFILALFLALLLFPLLLLLILLLVLLNYWQSFRNRHVPKPKGTVEILPSEKVKEEKAPEKPSIIIEVHEATRKKDER